MKTWWVNDYSVEVCSVEDYNVAVDKLEKENEVLREALRTYSHRYDALLAIQTLEQADKIRGEA